MTERNRRVQRLTRARMAETGENYTTALRAIKEQEAVATSDEEIEPDPAIEVEVSDTFHSGQDRLRYLTDPWSRHD